VAEASIFGPPSSLAGVPEAIVAKMQEGLQREAAYEPAPSGRPGKGVTQ